MKTSLFRALAVAGAVMLMGTMAACSSSKSSSSSSTSVASGSTGGTEAKATGADKLWCGSVNDLIQQSGGGGISVSSGTAALSQALVSLSSTAPSAIATDMQFLATTSQAAVAAQQAEPGATLPQATQDQAKTAWANVSAWVSENCGLTLPPLTS